MSPPRVEHDGVRGRVVRGVIAERGRERDRETADARGEWRVERETPTMDTDTAMRWTRRSASRDADGCLWAGYGWTSENESDKTFILFARRATLLQSSATGLPPASRIGRVEARHRCPPTSREERLRDELLKKKKDRVVRATASF